MEYTGRKWKSEGIQPEVRGIIIRGDDGGIIARVADMGGTVKEVTANANLIAAAPDMYEALKAVLARLKLVSKGTFELPADAEVIKEGDKALAKADGKPG